MDNRDTREGGHRDDERYGAGPDRERDPRDRARDDRAFSGRPDDRQAREQSYGRPGQYTRPGQNQGGGDRYGQRAFGDHSGAGGYGEGGYASQRGGGGYGPQGYGAEERSGAAGTGRGGGTYGQQDFSESARRSQYRDDQRYGDHTVTGETWRNEDERGDRSRSENYGAVDSSRQYSAGHQPQPGRHDDHEPHYRRWRDDQLASHDRDYAHWRETQARRYDEDYHGWRDQRREGFSRDFETWRQDRSTGQTTGIQASAAGASHIGHPGSSARGSSLANTAPEPVQGVTDGHTGAHPDDHHEDRGD